MSGIFRESLLCLECDERHAFPADMLLYLPPEKATPPSYRDWDWGVVLTDRVWCYQCEGPSYLERIPSNREYEVAVRFRTNPDIPRPEFVEDELLEIDDFQFEFLVKHLTRRQPSRSCLFCGSKSVRHLQLAKNRVVNLRHPYCNGTLQFDQFFSNGFGEKTIRWFSIAGEQITIQQISI